MFGIPDNFDTEYTEHQHITDAKEPYKRTNKINPVQQMVKHMERKTALQLKYQYLESLRISQKVEDTTLKQPSIGSCVHFSMHIDAVESSFGFKGLEHYVRSYLHDISFSEGEGRKHWVGWHSRDNRSGTLGTGLKVTASGDARGGGSRPGRSGRSRPGCRPRSPPPTLSRRPSP